MANNTVVVKKAPNYSYYEKMLVMELMKKYVDIIEERKNNSAILQNKEIAWENIMREFNAR